MIPRYPIELIKGRSAAAAFVSVVQDVQLVIEHFAAAQPGPEGEAARALVTELAAALDPQQHGSAAAVLSAFAAALGEES